MRISFTDEIDGGRILHSIGRVRATSAWIPSDSQRPAEAQQDAALRALMEAAAEYEADAIVGVGFEIDGASYLDLSSIDMKRVAATGVAVKLARG